MEPPDATDGQDILPGELLVPEEIYLTSGVHIGTQQKSASMRRFVYKVRFDGLHVLDIRETDRRIRLAAKFLASFPADRILAVSQRQYGQKPVRIFAKSVGAVSFAERFVPGCLTNPNLEDYFEPKVIVITDPATDQQALSEAVSIGIPVVGLCDVNNETRNVDLVIPANNKGRVALATVYWLLTRELLKARGGPTAEAPYTLAIADFQAAL
ncbi:MAG TPA: 30S ribosomal protein S2 [Thermoplasmata archaeon]|nr:30S ribosomal protein S2 [Thermoplasmata archaeon]HUJ77702.1 30S ribosomal protein S2 [Thermoplasmata archaeon]